MGKKEEPSRDSLLGGEGRREGEISRSLEKRKRLMRKEG